MSYMAECELCNAPGGGLLWQDTFCRVVLVDDMDYPGFCRVILNRHVKEMSDLGHAERERLIAVVFLVEQAVREVLQPQKINLASLGNKTPHLHWHVIPRFEQDKTFPNPIWGKPVRQVKSRAIGLDSADKLKAAIQKLLG
jgi:diadenosine tetraphosphate (Ap4A) HIT family hydrolase